MIFLSSAIPVGKADSRAVRDRIAQYQTTNFKSGHNNPKNGINSPLTAPGILVKDSDRMQSVLPNDADEEEDIFSTKKEDEGDTFSLADGVEDGLHVHEARLQPNVKGCGYPPDVECK